MTQFNEFKPSVTAELEEWDETTDVIVWLIEQNEQFHLSCPNLKLEQNPERHYGRSSYETLESQTADLTGYTKEHHKVKFTFTAEAAQIKVPEPDDPDAETDGYKITVEQQDPATYRNKPFVKFTIKGYNRSNFEAL
jgi:hypothetical protein